MSGNVDDKVQLHLIDTRQLVEEAQKIREAKKLAQDAGKAKKELAAGVSPLSNQHSQVPTAIPTTKSLGTGLAPLTNNQKQQQFIKKQQQLQTQQQKVLNKSQKQQQKQQQQFIKMMKQWQKQIGKGQKQQQIAQRAFQKKLLGYVTAGSTVTTAITNPSLIPVLALQNLKQFGVIGAVVASALSYVIGPLAQQIQDQFNRGGVFDNKLKVPRQALTLNQIDDQNAYRDGTKYITSDLRVVQKAPQASNTLKISHEAIRYVLDDLGKYS